ncbi:PCRF domain-containing protein [Nostoc sp. UHCC 0251]|uniref:PCRF domain-containing protein n=1 Tax=Nostoc sp. UHCC 0251 TaxID=3110240 RepID=UPI002B218E81|nr:PCRF domain-containing protein [Nostoc sp. UHCC 0251]MEA5626382.1 PCRF domain-containing protein [Nostoc sp. UHCC 0251]
MLELLNIKIEVERLSNILTKAEGCLDLPELSARIEELNQLISQATFWDNSASFYQILQEIDFLKATKKQYQRSHFILEDIKAAIELLELSADEELLLEAQTNLTQLQQELETIEIQQLLSNPHDQKGVFLTITAGVGGADAQYWAYMLLRMYFKWAESHSYKILLVEESCGDLAGIKSASLEIIGRYAYGYLKSEIGTHQLEQISPFDVINSLHTSLASVEVISILGESVECEIPEKDLEITWPRYRGNVNRTETWVKMVHIPTGISVFCNQQRSLMQNKEKALAILKSKLFAMPTAGYAYALAQGVQIDKIQRRQIKPLSNKLIREYILHPYTNVKDLRTNVETLAATEVLNGKIDLFIKAYLQQLNHTTSVGKEPLDNFKSLL